MLKGLCRHKGHKKIQLNKLKKNLKESIKIIKKKNEDLLRIIAFNEAIINSFNNHKKNYLYMKSLKNVSKSFEREKERDSNDLGLMELNLSDNQIKNIEFLGKMNLPFLELLNLSNNEIEDIEPLGEIDSRKLKFLFIQHNKIRDIKVFKNHYQDLKMLEIVRLEENEIQENSEYTEVLNLYNSNEDAIIKSYIDRIKKEFKINEIENEIDIKIESKKKGNSILRKLFVIISQNSQNKIMKLTLSGNEISDPSLLNRIQFDCLSELDLSFNKITNINFIKGMKAKKLNRLLLNDNHINDLSPLKNYNIKHEDNFPYLEKITLKNNNCLDKQPNNKIILSELKNSVRNIDY